MEAGCLDRARVLRTSSVAAEFYVNSSGRRDKFLICISFLAPRFSLFLAFYSSVCSNAGV